MNLEFFLLLGAFLLGVLAMGWIKQFQVEALRTERNQAISERDAALEGQRRTQSAADEVVKANRRILAARDVPGLDGLKLLLLDGGDGDPSTPGPPGGVAG